MFTVDLMVVGKGTGQSRYVFHSFLCVLLVLTLLLSSG